MKRVLVLGGGFGGLAAAHHLRKALPEGDEVVVVERNTHFMMGLRKTWVLTGASTSAGGQRPLAALEQYGIRVKQGTITAIDPSGRAVDVDGERIEADAMIVALGAQLAPELMPGFNEYALNIYDPTSIEQAAAAVEKFEQGRLTIGVFGAPYKCPPAPYEIAMMLTDFFRTRQRQVTIEVFTPQPASMPVLGEAGCAVLDGRLSEHGIIFLANHKATNIEAGQVVFGERRRPFDLLLGIPPHKCPDVVKQSGLTGDANWVRINPQTMETAFPGVYAIGDTTEILMANGSPLPKAGLFAESEGKVAASNIAAMLEGRAPDAVLDGNGYCFMEIGGGMAVHVTGDFLAQPAPSVKMTEPSESYLQGKHDFETERLAAWFGS